MNGCKRSKKFRLKSIFIREMSADNNNTQYFIDHEKIVSSQQQRSRDHRRDETSRSGIDFRVMRCFCGCTALTHDQIEHFAMMNVSALIVHPICKNLFRNFLRIGHRTDESEALIHFECHEMCENFLENLQLVHNQSTVELFLNRCPSYVWEERIRTAFQGDHEHIIQTLKSLQQECVHSIECHNDYARFRRELLRKIGKTQT